MENLNTKLFKRFLGVLISAVVVYAMVLPLHAEAKKVAFSLDKAEKLKKVDGSEVVKIKDKEILFIRDTEKTVRALSSLCTHQKCELRYSPEKKVIKCPCHDATYDLDGKPLSGPPKEPLKTYKATLEKDKIVVEID